MSDGLGRIASLLEVGTGSSELTVRKYIFEWHNFRNEKIEIDQKFDEIVEFSGILKYRYSSKRYSSGMRVRLAFSMAI